MEEFFYEHILCVNANNPNDKELHDLRYIVLDFSKKADHWGQRMPSRWLLLEDKLTRKKAEGIRVMTLDELESLNQSSSPKLESRDELFLFLAVHHEIGTLIHFPDEGLQNLVILDAQWLVDSLKTIISAKRFRDHRYRRQWDRLHKEGIVEKEFIYSVWKDYEKDRFLEFNEQLILLMNTMDLISSPRQYNRDGKHVASPYFVVPCMLQTAPTDLLQKYWSSATHSNFPLKFEFEYSFLPSATVYRLLSTCILQYGDSDESKPTVYCDAAVFRVYKSRYLTLDITAAYIIANVISFEEDRPDAGVSQGVREFLDDTLKCITVAQKTTSKYEISVACVKDGKTSSSWPKWNDIIKGKTVLCKSHGKEPPHIVKTEEIKKQWLVMKVGENY